MRNKMDAKLQDKACYNDCYYKMKQMVTVMEVNKRMLKIPIQLQIQIFSSYFHAANILYQYY